MKTTCIPAVGALVEPLNQPSRRGLVREELRIVARPEPDRVGIHRVNHVLLNDRPARRPETSWPDPTIFIAFWACQPPLTPSAYPFVWKIPGPRWTQVLLGIVLIRLSNLAWVLPS